MSGCDACVGVEAERDALSAQLAVFTSGLGRDPFRIEADLRAQLAATEALLAHQRECIAGAGEANAEYQARAEAAEAMLAATQEQHARAAAEAVRLRAALVLTEEALDVFVTAARLAGADEDAGDNHALATARAALRGEP